MGQVLDFNAISNALKNRYMKGPVKTSFVTDHPFVANVPKDETLDGSAFNIAVKYGVMSTRAVTVPTALVNGSPDQYGKFTVPNFFSDYAVMQISGPAWDAAQSSEGSMIKLASETLDGGHKAMYDQEALKIFGNGGGSRGQLSATTTVNTATITLADPSQVLRFSPGMVLAASVDDGTGGALVRSGTVTLTGIDYNGGKLTASGNWNTGISAIAASDFLFQVGDYAAVYSGLGAWLLAPGTSPGATTFYGQDRRVNTLLAGFQFAGAGADYDDTITQLVQMVNQLSGKPDAIYVHPLDWAAMAKQQATKIKYERGTAQSKTDPTLSFQSLKFAHSKGIADILADTACPIGHFYVITNSSWKLYSNGSIIRPQNNWYGQMWAADLTDDKYQGRLITRSFLGSDAPWENGHGTF